MGRSYESLVDTEEHASCSKSAELRVRADGKRAARVTVALAMTSTPASAAALSSAAPPSSILLLAPGRSGSTLLQSAFLSSCDVLTFFEPCRHAPGGGDVHRKRCVPQALRFLECRLPQHQSRWDPPELRGWLRHPYNDANTSCAAPAPFATVEAARLACRAAPVVLVKEIRLVGQIENIAAALQRRRRSSSRSGARAGATAIVHLVRDPRPMLLSQRRLGWWNFANITGRRRAAEMERVAKRLCGGMAADADAGQRLQRAGRIRYVPVRFEELASDLAATTARLYGALGLPLPGSTRDWLNRTLRGQCAHGDAASANGTAGRQRFEYSTCRARPSLGRPRWKKELSTREKRIIGRQCAAAMRAFGYGAAG